MISREIERAQIPAAQICTMIPVANEVGSLRTIPSGGIVSPTGSPELSPEEEKAVRRQLVLQALRILQEERLKRDKKTT